MSKAPEFEPRIVEVLQAADRPMTVREIADGVGCSQQQVYKVLRKLKVARVGRSETGGWLYEWGSVDVREDAESGIVIEGVGRVEPVGELLRQRGKMMLYLDQALWVRGLRRGAQGVEVEVEDEHGERRVLRANG